MRRFPALARVALVVRMELRAPADLLVHGDFHDVDADDDRPCRLRRSRPSPGAPVAPARVLGLRESDGGLPLLRLSRFGRVRWGRCARGKRFRFRFAEPEVLVASASAAGSSATGASGPRRLPRPRTPLRRPHLQPLRPLLLQRALLQHRRPLLRRQAPLPQALLGPRRPLLRPRAPLRRPHLQPLRLLLPQRALLAESATSASPRAPLRRPHLQPLRLLLRNGLFCSIGDLCSATVSSATAHLPLLHVCFGRGLARDGLLVSTSTAASSATGCSVLGRHVFAIFISASASAEAPLAFLVSHLASSSSAFVFTVRMRDYLPLCSVAAAAFLETRLQSASEIEELLARLGHLAIELVVGHPRSSIALIEHSEDAVLSIRAERRHRSAGGAGFARREPRAV